MEYDDKTMALAQFLKVDPALIEEGGNNYFSVNERVVKHGTTPEEYKKLAEDFRALLDEHHQELVTLAITEMADIKGLNLVYDTVSDFLEAYAPFAQKRAEQLERLNTGRWQPPIKETVEDIYNRLKKEHWYVSNVLYNMVKGSDSSLRRAWLGQPLSDTRTDRTVNDGEYLVLTDGEADDWEEEGLRSLWDDMTHEVPESMRRYLDEDRFIEEHSGNRGENIGGYDSQEHEVEFEGNTFYIYRHN